MISQDFDVRWGQALFSASDVPSEAILDGLYKSNYRTLFSSRLFWLCLIKNLFEKMDRQVIYDRKRNVCQTSQRSDDENSKLHSPERSCGKRSREREESGIMFSVEVTWTMIGRRHTLFQSWQTTSETVTEVRDEKDDRPLPHPIRTKPKIDGEGEKSSNESSNRDESSSVKRSKISCRYRYCNDPSCCFWHPPVCVKTKSLKLDAHLAENAFPAGQRMLVRKDQLRCWRSLHDWVVYLNNLTRENLINLKREIGCKTRRQILQEHLTQ